MIGTVTIKEVFEDSDLEIVHSRHGLLSLGKISGARGEKQVHEAASHESEPFSLTPVQEEIKQDRRGATISWASLTFDVTAIPDVSIEKLAMVWQALASQHSILRTKLVEGPAGTQQLISRRASYIRLYGDNENHPETAFLVLNINKEMKSLSLKIHPLLIDQSSLHLLLTDFTSFWNGFAILHRPQFGDYAQAVKRKGTSEAISYWRSQFDRHAPSAVAIPGTSRSRSILDIGFGIEDLLASIRQSTGFSENVIISAAWALVLSRHTASDQVMFNVTDRDRKTLPNDGIIGPLDVDFPIRLTLDGELSGLKLLQHVCEQIDEAGSYSYIGRSGIIENVPEYLRAIPSIRLVHFADHSQPTPVSTGIDITICVPTATVHVEADTSTTQSECSIMVEHMWQALRELNISPEKLLQDFNLVSRSELGRILDMGLPQYTAGPATTLHDLITQQAHAQPDKIALQFEDGSTFTYAEVDDISHRLATILRQWVRPGSIVAIHADMSCQTIMCLLAIIKAGGAYLIIDPLLPTQRKAYFLKDSHAEVCIVSESYYKDSHAWSEDERKFLILGELLDLITRPETENPTVTPLSDVAPAYIVYTSGSSGEPKGAVLSHRAACAGIQCSTTDTSTRRLLFYNPIFSAAQRTIWSTLAHGGCLCLASQSSLTVRLSETINTMQITDLGITSSAIVLLDPASLTSLKRVTMTGEPISREVALLWSNKVELFNNYGLTECTQLNWGCRIDSATDDPSNIGKPRDTTGSIILTAGTTSASPLCVPGELCLYGPQLATQYLNKPSQTSEKFIDHPHLSNQRLYRTGDLAVRHLDGSVSILGRCDDQLKVNGQRVEPREIELVTRKHDRVVAAIVTSIVIEQRKTLVAFIQHDNKIEWKTLVSSLRDFSLQKLPIYMIPTYWIEMETMPLNANGKVDYPSLKAKLQGKTHADLVSELLSDDMPELDENLTEPQILLRTVISAELELPKSAWSMKTSFFELAGDSLRAIRIVSALLAHGYSMNVRDLLLSDNLYEAADKMQPSANGSAPLSVVPFSLLDASKAGKYKAFEDAYPVTPLQESVLSAHILSGTYVYDRVFKVDDADIDRLRGAFQSVIARNQIYRTKFVQSENSYDQVVHRSFELPWNHMTAINLETYLQQIRAGTRDLNDDMIKVALIADDLLVVSMHHALFDFWSSSFLFDDVNVVYRGGAAPDRPSFSAFVYHSQNLSFEKSQSFWAHHLENAEPTILGKDAADFGVARRVLTRDFKDLSSGTSVSFGAFVYAAWAVVLWKHTGQKDVTFAITLSGRDAPIPNVQTLNGPTLATVPIHLRIDSDISFLEFAKYVQSELWNIAEFAQYGLRNALAAANVDGVLFDSLVNFLVRPGATTDEDVLKAYGQRPTWETGYKSLEVEELEPGRHEIKFSGRIDASKARFILDQVCRVLEDDLNQLREPLRNLSIVRGAELEWLKSLAACDGGVYTLLQEPFENVAGASAQSNAIEFRNERAITYTELNARANQLARHLREQSIGPDVLVPICLPKSVQQIVCILAVLKAGGAFVPLDPDNPIERNNFIVRDVSATIVLTDENYAPLFEQSANTVKIIDVLELDCSSYASENLRITGLTPENLAYAIYTSGSTGVPKGVLIPHKSISSGIDSIVAVEGFESSWRVLQFSNYVFDVAIGDIFCTFRVGATLCMAPMSDLMADLAGEINRMSVDRIFLTPTVAKLLSPEDVPQVRGIYLAGEQVTQDLVEKWTPYCKVMNCYGPTEASILVAAGEITAGSSSRIIGAPLRHCSGMILERDGTSMVPFGAVGELCFGGFQLAREYLNRPDATAKAFINLEGRRIYRTGDLACWTADGRIECLGRMDSQVKISGHRIEIGEVEAAILATQVVPDTVVVAAKIGDRTHLIAFCVMDAGTDLIHGDSKYSKECMESLTALSLGLSSLSPYMVPQHWVALRSLPRSPSGKADRRRLLTFAEEMDDTELSRYALGEQVEAAFTPPSTPEQFTLRSLWAEMFAIDEETVSATGAFFMYGGDSIAAINLSGKCRGLGFSLSVSDIMAFPLLQDMAAHMRLIEGTSQHQDAPGLEMSKQLTQHLAAKGLYNDQIEAVWPSPPGVEEFLIRGADKSQSWQCQTVRPLPPNFDWSEWIRLTTELTRRNEILRTLWAYDNDRWIQIVLKHPTLDSEVIRCASPEHRKKMASRVWDERFTIDSCKPFVRYRLLETESTGERHLLIKIHHAMYDGTLLRIFDEQFQALHNGSQLPESVAFAHYVGHISSIPSQSRDDSLEFWAKLLADGPLPFPSPAEHRLPAQTSSMILKSASSRVDGFAAQCGVTIPIVFQSAFTVLLADLGGTSEVIYDNLITGRNIDMENAQLINGNCANFLPFRGSITESTTVRDLLKATQDLFWKATEHGDVNLTAINEALGDADSASPCRSLFLFQPFEPVTGTAKHMRWMVMAGSEVTMPIDYALHLEVSKTIAGYNVKFKFDENLFCKEEADRIGDSYLAILDEMILRSFSVLSSFDTVSLEL
ncbi:putative nonribosomal peptide synthase [Dissoconium aciculare CBS 342.82]|uniref:Nonribosomal peptide synthase n=1 Tax=Dissoconium aciculare CBS 342.82 TaxID=1314786 RepID=A0A6J3LZL0_9PEZI|nr:putative nonribosomal peptide synthase [Dissoconium aciculare CBS 342.82]KAF1821211.1 putative nonribosomal peptide synthase [Dissoconium aciculare CBS 342.82]